MGKFWFNLSKASTATIIAMIIIIGVVTISTVVLFHKPADKDLAMLVIGNIFTLAGFVSGYYFNKRESVPTNPKDISPC